MRCCEKVSGEAEKIETIQRMIQRDIESVNNTKSELRNEQKINVSKDEHIDRLYMFIGHIGVNFRNENYEEVDRLLKKINL